MHHNQMFSPILFLLGCSVFVVSTPVTSEGKVGPDQHAKDSSYIRRAESPALDLVAEAANYGDGEVLHEPQHFAHHSHRLPDTPLPSIASEETRDHSIELEGGSQHFFPSFAHLFQPRHQPIQNSRQFFNQEGAYSQRPNPLKQLLNYQAPPFGGYKTTEYIKPAQTKVAANANGILGSGNFGVLSGGTFFGENNDNADFTSGGGYNNNPYDGNNGHGRPAFYFGNSESRPYNQDQFANFRDFADINAPSSSAFSHFVVVYANENGTLTEEPASESAAVEEKHANQPKNIIERLTQLEEEKKSPMEAKDEVKKPKISKSKFKLALIKDKKFGKNKKKPVESELKDLSDPLIALS